MKLKDWSEAEPLMNRLRSLEMDMAMAAGDRLGVTIQGCYQDDKMLDAVRTHVLTELERRHDLLLNQLHKLGVYDID